MPMKIIKEGRLAGLTAAAAGLFLLAGCGIEGYYDDSESYCTPHIECYAGTCTNGMTVKNCYDLNGCEESYSVPERCEE